jgi:hypothetical protein
VLGQTPDPWDNERPPYSSVWFTPFTDPLDERIDKLSTLMEGEYRGRWPGAFAKRPDVDEVPAWAVWKRVHLPAFGSRVFFMEVREGGPDGRILRQRIVELSDDPLRSHNFMRNYVLLDVDRYARADLDPSKLAGLTRQSLPLVTRGCQTNVIGDGDGFAVGTDKASCVFLYPDGKARYNDFHFRFQAEGFTFFEAAYDVDGRFLAGAVRPVTFTRVTR